MILMKTALTMLSKYTTTIVHSLRKVIINFSYLKHSGIIITMIVTNLNRFYFSAGGKSLNLIMPAVFLIISSTFVFDFSV